MTGPRRPPPAPDPGPGAGERPTLSPPRRAVKAPPIETRPARPARPTETRSDPEADHG